MWNFLELSDPSKSCSFLFVCVLTFSFHESAAWNWKHLPQLEDSAKAFAEQFFSYDLGIEAWCVSVGMGAMKLQVRDEQIDVDGLKFVDKDLLHFFDRIIVPQNIRNTMNTECCLMLLSCALK